jgi:hypothetical protein
VRTITKKLIGTNLSWTDAENLWDSRTKETNAIHEIRLAGATGKWSVYQRLTNGEPTILSVKF